MTREGEAHFIRTAKLAAIAAVIDIGIVGASFVAHGNLRKIAVGAAAGLTLSIALMLIHAYRRRGPAEPSPITAAKRARQAVPSVSAGLLLGGAGAVLLRPFDVEWLIAGFFIGLFGFFALMISPLFWTGPPRRTDASPRAQMTSAERAVNLHYE